MIILLLRVKLVMRSFLVLLCLIGSAVSQGPRLTCERCNHLQEEIGKVLGVHMPTLNVDELEKICPKLKEPNSTIYCQRIIQLWKNMASDKEEKEDEPVDVNSIANFISYMMETVEGWLGLDMANFDEICKFVNICH